MAEVEGGILKLGRVEGIDTADELLTQLREFVSDQESVKIDGSAVISVDSTTLQMLVVLTREITQEGASVTWEGASKKLIKSADALGLTEELGL